MLLILLPKEILNKPRPEEQIIAQEFDENEAGS
jgi:hypothetical protein